MARPEGVEPPAYRFEACRSIQLSYGRVRVLSVSPPSMDSRIGGALMHGSPHSAAVAADRECK